MNSIARFSVFALLLGFAVPAHSAQFKIRQDTLTVPDGFEIELVASSPLVDRPITASFDDQGRLYVTDSSGSSAKGDKQLADKSHRVVRLVDSKGDGHFDQSTVFADKMMFPEGALWYDGSLYVSAPPQIWKLTDTNDDGVADQREAWFDGKTLTGCANDLHGPYLGPDGWIYWCKGAFAEQQYTLPNGKPFVTKAAHIFRARPDGTGIEPVLTGGMDNPVGVAFSSTGERFLCGTFFLNPAGGKRDGLIHAIYGGVYGKVNDVLNGHPRTGDLMPIMTHLGPAAPAAVTCYRPGSFGPDFNDNLFSCQFNLHRVQRHILTPDGASFKTKDEDFVTSDNPDFHPTDVLEDADGSLLVVDTGGWYKICCPTSQLAKPEALGAIYRVRRKGAPRIDDPRGAKLAWVSQSPASIAGRLADARPAVRERTMQTLAKLGSPAISAIVELAKHANTDLRRNSLWALTRINGDAARQAIRDGLKDEDKGVRLTALRSISLWRDSHATPELLALLKNGDPHTQRAVAEILGRTGASAVPAILEAASKANDRILEHALTYALLEIDSPAETAKGLASANSLTRRTALIALDQMEGGTLQASQVTPLLASADPVLKQTAAWIVEHHSNWGDALAGFFENRLAEKNLSPDDRAELQKQLAQFARNPTIQFLLEKSLASASVPKSSRLTVLQAMAQAGLKETPPGWISELSPMLGSGDPDLIRQAVMTARSLTMPKGGAPELATALLKIGNDSGAATETRLDALAAVPGGLSHTDPAVFAFLSANALPDRPVLIRSAAASVLGKARLNPEQLTALIATVKAAGPLELPKLLDAYAAAKDESLGLQLIAALKQATAVAAVRGDMLKPRIAKFPPTVQKKADELVTSLNADAGQQKAHLEELLATTKDGNVVRGQTIFNSAKAACSSCHAIGYLGGKVGPDLTRIGQVRNERDLLESIVYPSASFVRSFEPMIVSTKSGEDYNGIVKQDTAEELVLVSGPNAETRIARADIREIRPGSVSVMPAGLDQQLTRQELADLVAFLKATKW